MPEMKEIPGLYRKQTLPCRNPNHRAVPGMCSRLDGELLVDGVGQETARQNKHICRHTRQIASTLVSMAAQTMSSPSMTHSG
jgi:hypothetical protein